MRDLKHLIYFENLLQEANNDLVKQAKSDGKLALGYTCYFMPEVLLDLPGCVSVRLRAPRCTSPDMATYYMSSRTCHYGRSLLERALEGGFNFLNAQLATETCTVTCRFQEHLQRMDIIQNEKFKCEFTDVPFKKTANSIDHYEAQLKAHVVDFLHDNYGVDTSDEAILKTIESHNELCRIVQEIGDYRKLDNPTITGYEFHVINLVTLACPKYLIIDKLRETLEELRTREPDTKPAYRCKVLLAGSENDDPDFTKLIESCGALVVADRYCYGAMESRQPIEIREGETPLRAIAPAHAVRRSAGAQALHEGDRGGLEVHRGADGRALRLPAAVQKAGKSERAAALRVGEVGRGGQYQLLSHQRRGAGAVPHLPVPVRRPSHLARDGQEGAQDHGEVCGAAHQQLPADAPPCHRVELRAAVLLQLVHMGV